MKDLGLKYSFQEIQNFSKVKFKNLVKEKVRQIAFQYLMQIKQSHTKAKDLDYHQLALQEYLKPEDDLSINEKRFIFAARSNMLDLHANFKLGKSDTKCRKCGLEDE